MKIRISLILLFVFAILIMVFTLQNTEIVNVKLLFWEFTTSRALLIVVSVAIGTLLGVLIPPLLGKKKDKAENDTTEKKQPENTSEKNWE